jgi:hypothetical protein
MSRKIAVALSLVASVGTTSLSHAAPVAANTRVIKDAALGGVTKIQWQWWVAGAAVGALAGAAWAAHHYGGCGYYGGYGCGYRYGYGYSRGPAWGAGPYGGGYPGYGGWRRAYWRERYWSPPRAYW